MDHKQRLALVRKIEKAFADAPYPEPWNFQYEMADLAGMHWRDVPPHVLLRLQAEFYSYLSPAGFRFYLPAILRGVILHPREVDTLVANVITWLDPYGFCDINARAFFRFREQMSAISDRERAAIAEFLLAYRELEPHGGWTTFKSDRESLDRAIAYWTQPRQP